MRLESGQLLPVAGLVAILLAGCSTGTATTPPRFLAEMPLFGTSDGFASLNVSVIANRLFSQSLSDIEQGDRVLFTLSSSTCLSTPRTSTQTLSATASPQTFSSVFTNLKPGTDYYLKADVYLNADAGSGFTQNIVRGEGISSALTLTAGSAQTTTLKINSVGSIAFSASTFGNVVTDYGVVAGDTITVNTGITTTNSPNVSRIDVTYTSSARSITVASNGSNGVSAYTCNWTLPASSSLSASSETGTLTVTGYDSSSTAITYKSRAVTIYKPASVTPITLN